jgi:predicted RNA binding protein YcfA (HicA-like mRNA interferase family)
MSKLPRWTANQAEQELLHAGFQLLRSKGSHRVYGRGEQRVVVPFHAGQTLHPKIIKQVIAMIAEQDN